MAKKEPMTFAVYLQKSHPGVAFNIRHEGNAYTEEARLGIQRIFDAVTLICHQLTVQEILISDTLVKRRLASKKLYVQMDEAARMIEIRLVSSMRTYESAKMIFQSSFDGYVFVKRENPWLLGLEALYSVAKAVEDGVISQYDADRIVGRPGIAI